MRDTLYSLFSLGILVVALCAGSDSTESINNKDTLSIGSCLKDLELLINQTKNIQFDVVNNWTDSSAASVPISALPPPSPSRPISARPPPSPAASRPISDDVFTFALSVDEGGVVVVPKTLNVSIGGGVSGQPPQILTIFNVSVRAVGAGRVTVVAVNASREDADLSSAFFRVTVMHSVALSEISFVVGWIYFLAWSVSFYPQIYENWKRKSVIGLSFDFLGLNVIGFTLYSIFNVGLFWIPDVQAEYFSRHRHGVNPVQLNDVIFSLHAAFACAVTIGQCVVYERGNQSLSRPAVALMVGIAVFLVISLILAVASVIQWLDFLYYASYVKLGITLVKYIPQAFMNFRRKSTMGWSIGNVLLDFTGGTLSVGQMFIIAYNNNDWGSIFGDPTKFGLGLFSVCFDVVFILQHYVFYRNNLPHEELIGDSELRSNGEDEIEEEEEERERRRQRNSFDADL